MPDSQATARLAAAVGQILPVDGEHSLATVGAKFDLNVAPVDDAAAFAGQLITAAGAADTLEQVVRALVAASVMYRREAREPIDAAEYTELSAAALALGVTVPDSPEVEDASAADDGTERRSRLLGAMLDLYADMMNGPEDERPLKLANVLGGLLRANDIEILRLPQARAADVRGVVRMGSIEHLLTAVWEVGDDLLAVDTTEESVQAQDRRTLIVALQGFPREMRLDPERDRRKILLDGRDLTLLLEGRWTLAHAVRWKAREQRETGVFARLPMAPPENDPTALGLSSDTAEIVEVQADQKTLAANVTEFDQTISEEFEASEVEAKRLRLIGIVLAGIAVAVVVGLFINSKIQESIAAGNLDAASVTAMRAAQAQEDALERLEITGLNRYFSDDVIANIRQQIESLRANNVYITARIDREVLRENSGVQDELAFIAFRETGETELRGSGDGRIISSDPAYRAVLGFIMSRSETGQWLVTERRVFDSS